MTAINNAYIKHIKLSNKLFKLKVYVSSDQELVLTEPKSHSKIQVESNQNNNKELIQTAPTT